MVSVSRDKTIRLFDPRTTTTVAEAPSHQGIKASRVIWLGSSSKVLTTGFSRSAGRQIFVWDTTQLKEPIKQIDVDNSSGVLIPHFDDSTKCVVCCWQGDGNIRLYEWADEENELHYLSGGYPQVWAVICKTEPDRSISLPVQNTRAPTLSAHWFPSQTRSQNQRMRNRPSSRHRPPWSSRSPS